MNRIEFEYPRRYRERPPVGPNIAGPISAPTSARDPEAISRVARVARVADGGAPVGAGGPRAGVSLCRWRVRLAAPGGLGEVYAQRLGTHIFESFWLMALWLITLSRLGFHKKEESHGVLGLTRPSRCGIITGWLGGIRKPPTQGLPHLHESTRR